MGKYEKTYIKNKYSLFTSSLPKKREAQGFILGLNPMKVRISKHSMLIQLKKDGDWTHLALDRARGTRFICQCCNGQVQFIQWENQSWLCERCAPIETSQFEIKVNRYRHWIRTGQLEKLQNIKRGIHERSVAMELEGIRELASAPVSLSEAKELQTFAAEPPQYIFMVPPFQKGRLLWTEGEYVWVPGTDSGR